MAQSGFTPIKLYLSTTAAAVPTAPNLAPGELALNNNDGKLFYEDSAGVVQVLATKAATSGAFTTLSVTGVTTVSAGSAALPAIVSTTGTADTGFWFPAVDTVAASTGGTERMRITSTGGVFLGGNTALTNINLNVGKTLTGGANAFGVISNGQIQIDVTGIAQYFNAGGNQIVGTTTSQLRYYGATQGTISGTVTSQFGFYADATLIGATNNYGFYGNIAAATGRYNFYANGTADNVFVGTTSLGGAVGSEALRASPVGSSVNYMLVQGGTAGNGPTFTSQGSDTNIYMNFVAKGTGAFEFKSSGVRQFAIGSVPSAVNFVITYGSITGNNALITADGSDTNIGITLAPKGTGNVSFGTFTSSADVPVTGYITIKDQAGNVRKLAVIA
jgi:hypothetical protein